MLFFRFLHILVVYASLVSAFKFVQFSSAVKNIRPNINEHFHAQSSALKVALNSSIQQKLLWLPNLITRLFKFTKRSLSGQKLRDGIARFYDESSQIWYKFPSSVVLLESIIVLYSHSPVCAIYQVGCLG